MSAGNASLSAVRWQHGRSPPVVPCNALREVSLKSRLRLGAMSDNPRSFSLGRAAAGFAVLAIAIVLLLYVARLGGLIEPRSRARRTACLSNLHQIHRALEEYAATGDGQYPWRTGAAEPREAWRDLGLLYPTYADEPDVFICPGMPRRQRDESSIWFKAKQEGTPFAPSDTTNVISYGYCFDARAQSRKPWTSDASATVRALADKKAGITTTGPDLKRAAHSAEGRNVVSGDGSVEWQKGVDALDPEPRDDAVGAPGAKDYTDWWSDPPYHGE